MRTSKIFLLIALFLLSVLPVSAVKEKPKENEKIIKIYNDYVFGIKQFAKINYDYADADLIDETLSSILNMQNRVYIGIKTIDKKHTKYTNASFYNAFDVMNEVAIGTINTELDIIHQTLANSWDNKKSIKDRAPNTSNTMIWRNMFNRLTKLWNIYYSWDLRMNTLVRNTDLYSAYCVLSKTTEAVLADHKLAMKVLWEKWHIDEGNILGEMYTPIKCVLKKGK